MGEFEEKLNSILSSPKDMEKILGLARELSGSLGGSDQDQHRPHEEQKPESGLPKFDPKLISVLSRLMGEYNSSSSGKTAILSTIKPYIKEERRTALDKAVKIARLTHVARLAFSEFGGDLDIGL